MATGVGISFSLYCYYSYLTDGLKIGTTVGPSPCLIIFYPYFCANWAYLDSYYGAPDFTLCAAAAAI